MDLPRILKETIQVVNEASQFLALHFGQVQTSEIIEKEKNSLVSFADKGAEKILVEKLKTLLPEAGFLTEEDTIDEGGKEYTWIIDPLDGTTNYLYNIPFYSISVALYKGKTPLIGVVKEVNSGEVYSAAKGHGSHLNGMPIRVTKDKVLSEVLVATGFPYADHYDNPAIFSALLFALRETRGIRRLGTAAMDLCYVASGRFGIYYEAYLNPWDIAAGALIVQEAGGYISDFKGSENYHDGSTILACGPEFAETMLTVLSEWG